MLVNCQLKKRWQDFLREGISDYKDGRNLPAKSYVSKMSPYLHFGEISPYQLWHSIGDITEDKNRDHFCSELGLERVFIQFALL